MNNKHTEKGTFDSKLTKELRHQIADLIAQGANNNRIINIIMNENDLHWVTVYRWILKIKKEGVWEMNLR